MGTVTAILVNGIPVEEHIKVESEKEFAEESIEERRETISDIKRSLERRQACKKLTINGHSRVKRLDSKQIRKEYHHMLKREKSVVLEVLEQLSVKGAETISELSKVLKVKKETMYAHLSLMARCLPDVILKRKTRQGTFYQLVGTTDSTEAIYRKFKRASGELRSKYKKKTSEIKTPKPIPPKVDFGNVVLELIQKKLQEIKPITVNGEKLDLTITISGSIEVLFGIRK